MTTMTITDAKKFVLAGKAIFTVSNDKGEHCTFKVNKHKKLNLYFASVLAGPDNNHDYSYMGMLDINEKMEYTRYKTLRKTIKSRVSPEAKSWKVLDWTLNHIMHGAELPTGYRFMHEGRCGRCGRKLTVPESLDNGLGPECLSKMV